MSSSARLATALLGIIAIGAGAIAVSLWASLPAAGGPANPGVVVLAVVALIFLALARGAVRGARWSATATMAAGFILLLGGGLGLVMSSLMSAGMQLPILGSIGAGAAMAAYGLVAGIGAALAVLGWRMRRRG